jgi:hypothetical protein
MTQQRPVGKPAKSAMKKPDGSAKAPAKLAGPAASERIDGRIRELGDWRGKTLAKVRRAILRADPGIVEEWKWMGTPVWSHGGDICTGETYKAVVKLTFARGASLKDPARLFNSSLEGRVRRAIDIHEGEEIDEAALTALVREAVELNLSRGTRSPRQLATPAPRGRRGRRA